MFFEYCLDTGDINQVKACHGVYPLAAYSMNPSIAVKGLKGTDRTFLQNANEIREIIGMDTPLFLEAMGDTAEEMVEDAHALLKKVPGNTIPKIPACIEGMKAIAMLAKEGIYCSCTAIYDFNQALMAAEAGALYVAIYVSRIDKNGGDGIDTVRKVAQAFRMLGITTCKVSACSVKTPLSIEQAVLAGATNVTVDQEMLEKLITHPMTEPTLATFKSDWEGLFGKGMYISKMDK